MLTAKQISDYVDQHKDEAIEFLQEIVQTPSVTGNEEPVSFVFEKWMQKAGLEVKRIEAQPHRPNLYAEWFGTQKGKRFVFNGHMDVFPPDNRDPGYFGPWSGKIEDGYLYGRGSCDMKGGDAGVMMAVLFLKKMGLDPKGSVALTWMCDEENGGELGVQYLLKNYPEILNGDFGICPEPSNGVLFPQHCGILRGTVTYTGETGHTALLYHGETCIQKAVKAIHALYRLNDELMKRPVGVNVPPPHLTVAVINGGTAANVFPSKVTFWFDRRLIPGETHDEALQEIIDVLDQLKAEDAAYEYEMTVTSKRPLLEIPDGDPFIELIKKSYKEVMGKDVKVAVGPAGSDAAWIQKVTGMPIPFFGAADDFSEFAMGQPNERIHLKNWLDFIKVYMMTVVNALS